MNPRILFKFPSRSRPDKFFAALDNIQQFIGYDNYVIQATLDLDDPTMTTPEVRERLKLYPKVIAYWGTSGSKISACNRDLEFAPKFDIIILQSDDMVWGRKGFGREIVEDFNLYFKDKRPGVLHYSDGITGEKLITLSIMNKAYFNLFGYLYFNGYRSVCADNEFSEIAQLLGAYKFVHKPMYIHAHPVWGYADWDTQYRGTEASVNYLMDGNLLRERRRNLFGLREKGLL